MSSRRRYEHMTKVWLSCKTDAQRNNAEKWMRNIAKPWPDQELREIEEFILIQEDIRDDINWFGNMEEARIRQNRKMAGYRY